MNFCTIYKLLCNLSLVHHGNFANNFFVNSPHSLVSLNTRLQGLLGPASGELCGFTYLHIRKTGFTKLYNFCDNCTARLDKMYRVVESSAEEIVKYKVDGFVPQNRNVGVKNHRNPEPKTRNPKSGCGVRRGGNRRIPRDDLRCVPHEGSSPKPQSLNPKP